MNSKQMNEIEETKESIVQYSEKYIAIKQQAETMWPEWKIKTYNTSVAVSAHARKLVKQSS